MILRHSEQITGQLEEDYYKLEDLLKRIAREKGLGYRVKDWKTGYVVLPLDDEKVSDFSNFVGYKMVHGLFIPKTILLATFEKPEHHLMKRPEGAPAEYVLLSASYHPRYFAPWALQEKLQAEFPHRDVKMSEY